MKKDQILIDIECKPHSGEKGPVFPVGRLKIVDSETGNSIPCRSIKVDIALDDVVTAEVELYPRKVDLEGVLADLKYKCPECNFDLNQILTKEEE